MCVPKRLPFRNILPSFNSPGIISSKYTKPSCLRHFSIGLVSQPKVICVITVICFLIPTFPPSGASIGQIIPNCVECSFLCPIIIRESPPLGVLILLVCEIISEKLRLLRDCIKPLLLRILPILKDFNISLTNLVELNISFILASLIILSTSFIYVDLLNLYSESILILISRWY